MVADSRTRNVVGETKHQKELKKKLKLGLHLKPKALSCIKQDRLASRQELKAVVNILSHVGMSMDSFFPRNPLKAKVCGREDRQVHTVNNENLAFISDKESGQTRWDVPMQSASEDLRLVLCADQGSPLFTCYQFLAHSGANISLIRDELNDNAVWMALSGQENPVAYAKPGDLLMQMFQRDILKENDLEETSDEQLNFTRVMEVLGKVLTSEEYFALFRIARNVLELKVKFRRADSLCSALKEGHTMLLASIHEMLEYVLYLRCSPAKAAALLSTVEDETTKATVLQAMQQEWQVVLALEDTPAGASLLRQHCGFCAFQHYREVMTVYEKNAWKVTEETTALTSAWYPQLAWSASLESVFGDLQDATKRSGRSDCGSLPNLFAVGVRSLQNRLTVQDGSASPVKLQANDWTGTQAISVSSKNVMVDNILKPFPSTTAFFHNHHSLNFMQGKNPAVEAGGFWVQACFSTGMLLKYSGKFYLATGSTPAVLNVVRLRELPFVFKGPLPTETSDETRVPCQKADDVDVLRPTESTPALVLDVGRTMVQQLRFDYEEVKLFAYTLHVCESQLADKCGSAVLLRRGSQEFCLLCFLVQSELVLSSSSASLTELLQKHDIQMPKNSTKAHKVRRILAMEKVKEMCAAKTITKLLASLDEADAKKKIREKEKEKKDDALEEAEEIEWDELQEDPAAQACKELLARLDEEEEKELEEKDADEDHQLLELCHCLFTP
ncbi:unnamed protein product [Symbiodinium sp. CCMP2456]|nr:unnamed protein product [Symbiodinium sp. CCMP2456]